jgi:hypothetical protein
MPFPSALPVPRTPPARPVLRWGTLGTGWIANTFVGSLRDYTGQLVRPSSTSLSGMTPTTAATSADEAIVFIDGDFYNPGGFALRHYDGRELRYDEERIAHPGLHWQAAEVARQISAGERYVGE